MRKKHFKVNSNASYLHEEILAACYEWKVLEFLVPTLIKELKTFGDVLNKHTQLNQRGTWFL